MSPTVWTIGHSVRSGDALAAVLRAHRLELVADVRRFAGSRRLPHFHADALGPALRSSGIEYLWLPALGGRRSPVPDTPNAGWRVAAFRGYADHLATEEFADGLVDLLMAAHGLRTAIMCSEVLWWRCHRRLIADLLVSLGWTVIHVRDERHAEPHRLAPPARLVAGRLAYPAAP